MTDTTIVLFKGSAGEYRDYSRVGNSDKQNLNGLYNYNLAEVLSER